MTIFDHISQVTMIPEMSDEAQVAISLCIMSGEQIYDQVVVEGFGMPRWQYKILEARLMFWLGTR
ncbi:MAG: hypothetical protein AAGM33_11695 [Pseudomonadota bacterium]